MELRSAVVLLLTAGACASLMISLASAYPLFDRNSPTAELNGTVTLNADDFHRLINVLVDTVQYLKRSGTKCCEGCTPQPLMMPWMAVPVLPMNQPWYPVQPYSGFNGLSYVPYPPIAPQFAFSAQNGTLYSSKGRWIYPWPQRGCPCEGSLQQQSSAYSLASVTPPVVPYPEGLQQVTQYRGINMEHVQGASGGVDLAFSSTTTTPPPLISFSTDRIMTTYRPSTVIPMDTVFAESVETTAAPQTEYIALLPEVEPTELINVIDNVQTGQKLEVEDIIISPRKQELDVSSTESSSTSLISDYVQTEAPATENLVLSEVYTPEGTTQTELLVAYTMAPTEIATDVIYATTTPSPRTYTERPSFIQIEAVEATDVRGEILYTEAPVQIAFTEPFQTLPPVTPINTEVPSTVQPTEIVATEAEVYTTTPRYEAIETEQASASTEMVSLSGVYSVPEVRTEVSEIEVAHTSARPVSLFSPSPLNPVWDLPEEPVPQSQVIATTTELPVVATEMVNTEVEYFVPTTKAFEVELPQTEMPTEHSSSPPTETSHSTEVVYGEAEIDTTTLQYEVVTTERPFASTEVVTDEILYTEPATEFPEVVTPREQPMLPTELITAATYATDMPRIVTDLVQTIEATTETIPKELSEMFSTEWTPASSPAEFTHENMVRMETSSERAQESVTDSVPTELYSQTPSVLTIIKEEPTTESTVVYPNPPMDIDDGNVLYEPRTRQSEYDSEAEQVTTRPTALTDRAEEIEFPTATVAPGEVLTTSRVITEALPATEVHTEIVTAEVIHLSTTEKPRTDAYVETARSVDSVSETSGDRFVQLASTTSVPEIVTAEVAVDDEPEDSTEIMTAETIASVPMSEILWLNETSLRRSAPNGLIPVELTLTATERPKTDTERLQLIDASITSDDIANMVASTRFDMLPRYTVVNTIATPPPKPQYVIWNRASSIQPIQALTWPDDISHPAIGSAQPVSSYSYITQGLPGTYTVPGESMAPLLRQWTPSGEIYRQNVRSIPIQPTYDSIETRMMQEPVSVESSYTRAVPQEVSPSAGASFATVEEVSPEVSVYTGPRGQTWQPIESVYGTRHEYIGPTEPSFASSRLSETVALDTVGVTTPHQTQATNEVHTVELDSTAPPEVSDTERPQTMDATEYEDKTGVVGEDSITNIPTYLEFELSGTSPSTDSTNADRNYAEQTEHEAAQVSTAPSRADIAVSSVSPPTQTTRADRIHDEEVTIGIEPTEVTKFEETLRTRHREEYIVDATTTSPGSVRTTLVETMPTRAETGTGLVVTSNGVGATGTMSPSVPRSASDVSIESADIEGMTSIPVTTEWVDVELYAQDNHTERIGTESSTDVIEINTTVPGLVTTEQIAILVQEDNAIRPRNQVYAEETEYSIEDTDSRERTGDENKGVGLENHTSSAEPDSTELVSAEEVFEIRTRGASSTRSVTPSTEMTSAGVAFNLPLGQVSVTGRATDLPTGFSTVLTATTPASEFSSVEEASIPAAAVNMGPPNLGHSAQTPAFDYIDRTISDSATMDLATSTDAASVEDVHSGLTGAESSLEIEELSTGTVNNEVDNMLALRDGSSPILDIDRVPATVEAGSLNRIPEPRMLPVNDVYSISAETDSEMSTPGNAHTPRLAVTPEATVTSVGQTDSFEEKNIIADASPTPELLPDLSSGEALVSPSGSFRFIENGRPNISAQFPITTEAERVVPITFPEGVVPGKDHTSEEDRLSNITHMPPPREEPNEVFSSPGEPIPSLNIPTDDVNVEDVRPIDIGLPGGGERQVASTETPNSERPEIETKITEEASSSELGSPTEVRTESTVTELDHTDRTEPADYSGVDLVYGSPLESRSWSVTSTAYSVTSTENDRGIPRNVELPLGGVVPPRTSMFPQETVPLRLAAGPQRSSAEIDLSGETAPLGPTGGFDPEVTQTISPSSNRFLTEQPDVRWAPLHTESERPWIPKESSTNQETNGGWPQQHGIELRTWQDDTSAESLPFKPRVSTTEPTTQMDSEWRRSETLPSAADYTTAQTEESYPQTARQQDLIQMPVTADQTATTTTHTSHTLVSSVTMQPTLQEEDLHELSHPSGGESTEVYSAHSSPPSEGEPSGFSAELSTRMPREFVGVTDVMTETMGATESTVLGHVTSQYTAQGPDSSTTQSGIAANTNEMQEIIPGQVFTGVADMATTESSSTSRPYQSTHAPSSSIELNEYRDDGAALQLASELPRPIENVNYAGSTTGPPGAEAVLSYEPDISPRRTAGRGVAIPEKIPSDMVEQQQSTDGAIPSSRLQTGAETTNTVAPIDDIVTHTALSSQLYQTVSYAVPTERSVENVHTTEGRGGLLQTRSGADEDFSIQDRTPAMSTTTSPLPGQVRQVGGTPENVGFEPDEVFLEGEQKVEGIGEQANPWLVNEPDEVRLNEPVRVFDSNEGTVSTSATGSYKPIEDNLQEGSVLARGTAQKVAPEGSPSPIPAGTESSAESLEEFVEYDDDMNAEVDAKPRDEDKAKIVIEQSVHLPAVKTFDVIIPPVQSVSPAGRSPFDGTTGREMPLSRQHWQLVKNEIVHHLDELDAYVLSGKANITGETSRFAAHMLRRHLANMSTTAMTPAVLSIFGQNNLRQQQFAGLYRNLSASIQSLNSTSTAAERAERLVASGRASIQLARALVLALADGPADPNPRIGAERILFNARLILLEVINSIRASSDQPALALRRADLLSWEWLLGRTSQRRYVFSRVFSTKPHAFDVRLSPTSSPVYMNRFGG